MLETVNVGWVETEEIAERHYTLIVVLVTPEKANAMVEIVAVLVLLQERARPS